MNAACGVPKNVIDGEKGRYINMQTARLKMGGAFVFVCVCVWSVRVRVRLCVCVCVYSAV